MRHREEDDSTHAPANLPCVHFHATVHHIRLLAVAQVPEKPTDVEPAG
jgi:hypothetical protein